MNAKTIARITRILIAVVIALVFAIPVIAGTNNFELTNGEIVGVDSVYCLDDMTADDVDINISNAVTEPTKDYSVSYTSNDGSKKVINLRFSTMDETQRKSAIANAAETIISSSNPEHYKAGTTATLLNSEGKTVQQQTIIGNKNPMETVMYTGMKLTSSAVKTFVPEVSINTRNNGELVKISDVDVIPDDDSYIVKIKIPYIVLATAIAQNNNITLAISLEYNTFFDLDLALDLPLKTFLGEDAKLPEIEVKSPSEVEIDVSSMGISDMEATMDTVKVTIKDGKINISTTDGRSIVSTLESYLNEKGELEFVYEGEKYTLDKEMSQSLVTIVKSIMEGA